MHRSVDYTRSPKNLKREPACNVAAKPDEKEADDQCSRRQNAHIHAPVSIPSTTHATPLYAFPDPSFLRPVFHPGFSNNRVPSWNVTATRDVNTCSMQPSASIARVCTWTRVYTCLCIVVEPALYAPGTCGDTCVTSASYGSRYTLLHNSVVARIFLVRIFLKETRDSVINIQDVQLSAMWTSFKMKIKRKRRIRESIGLWS